MIQTEQDHLRFITTNKCSCSYLSDMSHLQSDYREGKGPQPNEDTSLSSVAWVTVPIMTALILIIALLLVNQKKQWIPVSCYKAPTKVQ